MALTVTIRGLSQVCGKSPGGLKKMWLFDPSEFDWTQATTSGVKGAYTAVEAATGATTPKMYPIEFVEDEGRYGVTQSSKKGRSAKYAHEWEVLSALITQEVTNFMEMLDDAGTCVGVGVVYLLNTGKIFVAGENIVNGDEVADKRLKIYQDGTKEETGKVVDDDNGATIMLKGENQRANYEYTGGLSSITAFEP